MKTGIKLVAAAAVVATLLSGCGKDDPLLTNFNCFRFSHLLDAINPGFAQKCRSEKLGVYNEELLAITGGKPLQQLTISESEDKGDQIKALLKKWSTEPNALTEQSLNELVAKYKDDKAMMDKINQGAMKDTFGGQEQQLALTLAKTAR